MFDQLQAVFRSLNSHGVKYLIIGGVAAIAHGSTRNTFDLDLIIEASPLNAQRLLHALLAVNFGTASLITAEQLLNNEITVFKDRVRIDVQTSTPGLIFEKAWERRQEMEAGGTKVLVVSKRDLIASKRASGRKKDLDDVRVLEMGQDTDTTDRV
jgi:predicted nucleotidyltransferase